MQLEVIKTKRLILRRLTQDDYADIFEHMEDDEIAEVLGLDTPEALTLEREKVKQGLATFNKHYLVFQLIDKTSDLIIGWCGYHTWYTDHFRAEIGYSLTSDEYKGKGFMSEAMEAVLHYGFNNMGLNRVEAFIGPGNTASRRLAEKFRFVKEGELRRHYYKNKAFENSVVYGLLRNEYCAGKSNR